MAAKTTAETVENVQIHDFEDRPMEYLVVQWHEDRNVNTGTKGRYDDRADAEAMVVALKKSFKDRTYHVIERMK